MITPLPSASRPRYPQPAHPAPPPGRLVDVGGYRLHLLALGAGAPTVVLDAGMWDFSLSWSLVQRAVAPSATVVAYDRAGYGWSDPGPRPRTSRQFAVELQRLLANAGLRGPFILVGQSLGGINVRVYADLFPEEVAGLVLVDPGHPQQWQRLPPQAYQLQRANVVVMRVLGLLARLGVLPLLGRVLRPPALGGRLPADVQPLYQAAYHARYFATAAAEFEALAASFAQAPARSLGDLPLQVLTAGQPLDGSMVGLPRDFPMAAMNQAWAAMHGELAALSRRGEHTVVAGSGHALHLAAPEVVVAAIRRVLAEAVLSR